MDDTLIIILIILAVLFLVAGGTVREAGAGFNSPRGTTAEFENVNDNQRPWQINGPSDAGVAFDPTTFRL